MTKQKSLKGQGCHTLLAHLLSGPVPAGWHPMRSPCSFALGLQEGIQAWTSRSSWLPQPLGDQRKNVSDSHFTDTERSKDRANTEVE